MQLAIIHLSDFHFKTGINPASRRPKKVFAGLGTAEAQPDGYIVVISGDIAFSGKREEYAIALEFIDELHQLIAKTERPAPVMFVAVPGNHDVNFSSGGDLRRALIESLPATISDLSSDSEIFELLTKPQTEFFDFSRKLPANDAPWVANLCQKSRLTISGMEVQINCYNTAFTSQLVDVQGQLFFPLQIAEKAVSLDDACCLSIAVFHHPYNWLESNNAIAFRRHIERHADVILTGHQHVDSVFVKRNLTGERAIYMEGTVMQEHGMPLSGFNLLIIDFEKCKYRSLTLEAESGLYLPKIFPDWEPFMHNEAVRSRFSLSPEYLAYLNDLGVGIQHPRKKNLTLSDVFTYPDLRRRSVVKLRKSSDDPPLIGSSKVHVFFEEEDYVAVFGPAQSGKTALAKTLFLDLLGRSNLVPLSLNGNHIHSSNNDSFFKLLKNACESQYGSTWWTKYKSLEREFRTLIIDDWHLVRLGKQGQKAFIDLAKDYFAKVVVIADDLHQIQELSRKAADENPLADFEHVVMMQMGYVSRGQLIDRWHTLGREYSSDDALLAREIALEERKVEQILGKNLLPSFPIVVLSILQAFEANHEVETKSGSYGYLHETIITSALTNISKEPGSLDTKYTFIGQMAFHVYINDLSTLSTDVVQALADNYFKTHGVRINVDELLRELLQTRLFEEIDGNYKFRYKHFYYYFVARYFRDEFASARLRPDLEVLLKEMANTVYFEDHTHILMFVLYLTRSNPLIQHLVQNANQIFSGYNPCDLDAHTQFLNKLYTEEAKPLLLSGDVAENREKQREEFDKDEDLRRADFIEPPPREKIKYSEGLDVLVKMNIAFKTLQLLGQVIRNYPGALLRETKVDIARAAYLLGLRILRAVLDLAESNIDDLRSYLAEIIQEHRSFRNNPRDLAWVTDEAVIALTKACSYSVIKRISYSVGMEELSETYREVLQENKDMISVRLVDVSIKLDHFKAFPEADIREIAAALTKNLFANSILRDLVFNHLLMFRIAEGTRMSIASLLDLRSSDPKYLDNPGKRSRFLGSSPE